jgi:hypothetical protein
MRNENSNTVETFVTDLHTGVTGKMRLFEYRTRNGSMFDSGEARGFVWAENVDEACAHFEVTENNEWTEVSELTEEDWKFEYLNLQNVVDKAARLEAEAKRLYDLADNMRNVEMEKNV